MIRIFPSLKRFYRSDTLLSARSKRALKEFIFDHFGFLLGRFESYQIYQHHRSRNRRLLNAEDTDSYTLSQAKLLFAQQAERQLEVFLSSDQTLTFGESAQHCLMSCNVVVVLYNQAELSFCCLRALSQQIGVDVRLVVVDNASSDSTSRLLARLRGSFHLIRNDSNRHFLAAANQAFEWLQGDFHPIVLVNNDAILEPLALHAALSCLQRFPRAGAVAGMILHPDGRLQEAASHVFSDGSCVGVGRRGDPLLPAWNTRRLVDFGSGCLLTLRPEVVQQFTGFDPSFSPAYYEETDLCLRLQEVGWQILYEPACRAMHIEYASSGGSLQFVEPLMARNRITLLERHHAPLAKRMGRFNFNPTDPRCLIDHLHHTSRILWIDDQPPSSGFGAGFARLTSIIETLASLGSWITIFTTNFVAHPSDQRLSSDYELLSGSIHDLAELLRQRSGFYTHVCASRHHNIDLLALLLGSLKGSRPVMVADIESLFSVRNWTQKYLLETGEILQVVDPAEIQGLDEELLPLHRFDRLLAVSGGEANLLEQSTGLPTWRVGHLLNLYQQSPGFDQRQGILFLGAIHSADSPNFDSLQWLLDVILPVFQALDGAASIPITISGCHDHHLVADLYHALSARFPQVRCVGYCADLSGLLNAHRVFMAPTRFAAGLPHKIHQAASHGLPVVTTPLIASQMEWVDGSDLLVAATAERFAEALYRLHNDSALWHQLSCAGLRRIADECKPIAMEHALSQAFDLTNDV